MNRYAIKNDGGKIKIKHDNPKKWMMVGGLSIIIAIGLTFSSLSNWYLVAAVGLLAFSIYKYVEHSNPEYSNLQNRKRHKRKMKQMEIQHRKELDKILSMPLEELKIYRNL